VDKTIGLCQVATKQLLGLWAKSFKLEL